MLGSYSEKTIAVHLCRYYLFWEGFATVAGHRCTELKGPLGWLTAVVLVLCLLSVAQGNLSFGLLGKGKQVMRLAAISTVYQRGCP